MRNRLIKPCICASLSMITGVQTPSGLLMHPALDPARFYVRPSGPFVCLGSLLKSQLPCRFVVNAFRYVEMFRLLKRSDRLPRALPQDAINWPGIKTVIFQSLLYFHYPIYVRSSGVILRLLLTPVEHYRFDQTEPEI